MNDILSEKEYQHFIMERLSQDNGYVVRKATSYDRFFAVDREMLFQFLNDTQPDEMAALRKIYKGDLEDTIVSFINAINDCLLFVQWWNRVRKFSQLVPTQITRSYTNARC